jgi:hypothetical protein
MATQTEIQALINEIVTNGNYSANELRPLLTDMLTYHTVGDWTAVVSNESNVALTNFNLTRFERTANDVTLHGSFTATLASGQTFGAANIDMGLTLRPAADFSGDFDAVGVISRTNGVFSGLSYIISESGTKLLKVAIGDSSAAAIVEIAFIVKYKIS